jgi:hypothetical protein
MTTLPITRTVPVQVTKAMRFCLRPRWNAMRPRFSRYNSAVVTLSLAAAACLLALSARYAAGDARYQISVVDHAFLFFPSLFYAVFWVWWKDVHFRVAGCFVGSLLFLFCAHTLVMGPSGGDMDFGPLFVAQVALIGCGALSFVACVSASLIALIRSRMHNEQG